MSASDLSASVHQRLLNKARESGRPFNELLQYYAMERFLYRLSRSPYVDKFILKAALMLTVWEAPVTRPTMDIDVLGKLKLDREKMIRVVREICEEEVETDGIEFDTSAISAERIREDADYEGIRIRFRGRLGKAVIRMQIDVGTGDKVVPKATAIDYPTLLDLPSPRLRGYSRESVIAEKFEAMLKLGLINSRMRDFYDVWLPSQHFDFQGRVLVQGMLTTLTVRRTEPTESPTAFSPEFAKDETKSNQWKAFIRKNRIEGAPDEFQVVVRDVAKFLREPLTSIVRGESFEMVWQAPGPWK